MIDFGSYKNRLRESVFMLFVYIYVGVLDNCLQGLTLSALRLGVLLKR